jgi:hypothetical protein
MIFKIMKFKNYIYSVVVLVILILYHLPIANYRMSIFRMWTEKRVLILWAPNEIDLLTQCFVQGVM